MLTNYMKAHNISWTNWNMTDGKEALAMVQWQQWNNWKNNTSSNTYLSESGKYVKDLFQNIPKGNYSIMMDRNDDYAFWLPEYRTNISTIITENTIDQQKIASAKKAWDITYMKDCKKVIAYIEDDPANRGKYILHLAGDGNIYCSPNSIHLFNSFTSLKKLTLAN